MTIGSIGPFAVDFSNDPVDSDIVVSQIQDILPDSLFPNSKDWAQSDIVNRVHELLAKYLALKNEKN